MKKQKEIGTHKWRTTSGMLFSNKMKIKCEGPIQNAT